MKLNVDGVLKRRVRKHPNPGYGDGAWHQKSITRNFPLVIFSSSEKFSQDGSYLVYVSQWLMLNFASPGEKKKNQVAGTPLVGLPTFFAAT
jgi:hypothetical protein